MKKYSAFFLSPLMAVIFIVAVLKGSYLLQHVNSMSGIGQAVIGFLEYLLTLGPATIIAMALGVPIFYLIRWIANWKLLSCLVGALLVVGSVSLIIEYVAVGDVDELIAGAYLQAILVGTLIYGTVFWFLITKYQDQ